MPDARAAVLIGGRVATGAVALVLGAGLIAAATFVPLPTAQLEPPTVVVTPIAAIEQVICPGSMLRLGDESGANATSTSAIGTATTVRASTVGEVESRALAVTDAGGGVGAPVALSAPTAPDAGIAGAQSQSLDSEDFHGFSAAECSAPSSDVWIVGGSTAVGRTALVTIANPGSVSATVSIEVYSEDGLVDAPGTTGIVVAAGSQRVLALAGFAPSLESLAVHVTSRGGPVSATIQQSIVRGIDPGGIDIIGATGAPATTQVVPGLVIANSVEVQGQLGLEGFADLDTVLRMLAPGADAATATVTMTSAADGAQSASFDVELEPGVVTDLPLDNLADGSYAVTIDSDATVVAALRASTVAGSDADLAWFTTASPLTGDALIPVATGPGSALSLSNTTSAAINATLDGSPIDVPAGSVIRVAVEDARSYLLVGGAGLAVSVGYVGAGRLGSYAVSAAATEEAPVVVHP